MRKVVTIFEIVIVSGLLIGVGAYMVQGLLMMLHAAP